MMHRCEGDTDGTCAVSGCWEDKEGKLWVGNSEYYSQVSFCPYCGFKAKVPTTIEENK